MSESAPSWVMVGIDHGEDGVALYASKELTQAQLESRLPEIKMPARPDGPFWSGPRIFTLQADMKNVIAIRATDWPSAFRGLFQQWSPHSRQRTAVGDLVALQPGETEPPSGGVMGIGIAHAEPWR